MSDRFWEIAEKAALRIQAAEYLLRLERYRNRAVALRRQSFKFRARWRMAEMELRDVIRILDLRQDVHAASMAAAHRERDEAQAELAKLRAERKVSP
jgi:hypothetical protein